ncbi:MAG: hypothetical protein HC773_00915 [Scytonema sp. CRU_2_7]|nr:hypothetical protein [Scytonema sp. CRU_2_7]
MQTTLLNAIEKIRNDQENDPKHWAKFTLYVPDTDPLKPIELTDPVVLTTEDLSGTGVKRVANLYLVRVLSIKYANDNKFIAHLLTEMLHTR